MAIGTYSTFVEPSRNEIVPVGTSNTSVCLASFMEKPRKVLTIRNTSPNATDIITVTMANTRSANNAGIVLRQFESFTDSTDSGYECWQGPVNAICATATGQISVFER